MKLIKRVVDFDKSGIEKIEQALDRRNYLVHHFFREHSYDILKEEGRNKMIQELEGMRNDFLIADTLLSCLTRALAKHIGITDEIINQILEEKMA